MNKHILNIVLIIHIFVIIFVTLIPFSNNNFFLFLHTIIVPFIIFHWIANKNSCILSTIELNLRKKIHNDDKTDNCFTCRIFEPIYDFKINYSQHTILIYFITSVLWIISTTKIYLKFKSGEIKKISDITKQ